MHGQLPCISTITIDHVDFAAYEHLPLTLLTKVLGSFSSELSSPLLKITKEKNRISKLFCEQNSSNEGGMR